MSDNKILKLVDITAGTNIDVGQLANLLAIMGKLDRCDVQKVIRTAIGTANALSCIKSDKSNGEQTVPDSQEVMK
ncbi:MAG: hypothetical protein K2J25_06010 [Oscillospiraceae bacterium]|nr:hypothetical protein [Oscillospiraceae bacterium]